MSIYICINIYNDIIVNVITNGIVLKLVLQNHKKIVIVCYLFLLLFAIKCIITYQ